MNWVGVAPDEGLIACFEQHPAPLSADARDLPASAAAYLAAGGMSLLVPLVAQRQLVGLLSLGAPLIGGAFSPDDLVFLTTLADEAAAAVRIVQLLDHEPRGQRPALDVNGCGGVSFPTSS
jgi:GAF domain-containing protein